MRAITVATAIVGCLIVAQGLLGIAAPESFLALIGEIQKPPVIYGAAAVRIMIGAVLMRAAKQSRFPRLLFGFGCLVTLGGLLTPFIGIPLAEIILGWWSQGGAPVIRAWACAALLLGAFVLRAIWPQSSKRAA